MSTRATTGASPSAATAAAASSSRPYLFRRIGGVRVNTEKIVERS
jgi:hypothetical protein